MKNDTDPPSSIDADDPNDVFEQMARKAGAALRRPAPTDGVARLRSARRRQQLVRTALGVGASVIIVLVGLMVLNRPSDQTIAPSDSPEATTALTTGATTPSTTTTTTIPAGTSLPYTLAHVARHCLVGDIWHHRWVHCAQRDTPNDRRNRTRG